MSVLLAYRANLIGHLISTSVWTFLSIFTMIILAGKTKNVLGWTQPELLLLSGGLTIVIGLFSFFFKKSFQHIPEVILYGDLDGLLLKPIDSQFFISLMYVHFPNLLRVLVGILFVIYVILKFQIVVTTLSIISFIILLFFGLMIYYSIWLMAATLLIWFPRLSNVMDVVNSLNHVSRYPPEMYKEFNIFIFLFVFPYTVILATPVHALIQKVSSGEIISLLLCSIVLFIISRKFWQFSLRYYGSASG